MAGDTPGQPVRYWTGEEVEHIPTEPAVVVEIDADAAFEHGRWRHATRFRRVRLDLQPDEIATWPDAPRWRAGDDTVER